MVTVSAELAALGLGLTLLFLQNLKITENMTKMRVGMAVLAGKPTNSEVRTEYRLLV